MTPPKSIRTLSDKIEGGFNYAIYNLSNTPIHLLENLLRKIQIYPKIFFKTNNTKELHIGKYDEGPTVNEQFHFSKIEESKIINPKLDPLLPKIVAFMSFSARRQGNSKVDPFWDDVAETAVHYPVLSLMRSENNTLIGFFLDSKYHILVQSILDLLQTHDDGSQSSDNLTNDFQIDEIISFKDFNHMLVNSLDQIASQKISKVVLTRPQIVSWNKDRDINKILSQYYSNEPVNEEFRFHFEIAPNLIFLGKTPELLVNYQNGVIQTEALAGTLARGSNEQEDSINAETLLSSEKYAEEHLIVVKQLVKSLEQYGKPILETETPVVRKLKHVQHLLTRISVTTAKVDLFNLLLELHPTPALGGEPKKAAVKLISEIEPFWRGYYGSPVGWIGRNGSGKFYVAIRSGIIKDNNALLYAGAGIVRNSDPQQEWDEITLKFKQMLNTLNLALLTRED
ncbi:MAG: isochorismate synthase [Candidatus Heimdallarchaeota archaeon]|nr:isochorismate synthase [Candidatus Heimdallarchaeota archaeon]